MPVTIDLAVAKTHKFGTRQSGDTVELVERPGGGFSAVIVDGQGSGAAAKRLSLLVAGHAVRLLHEGVRDGAAARAAHDFLFAVRSGQVSAELDIVSVDLASTSVLVTRNSEVPMLLYREGQWSVMPDSGGRIGIYRHTRPRVLEFPMEAGFTAILCTDGVLAAGTRWGTPLTFDTISEVAMHSGDCAQDIADSVLAAALSADRDRPSDDMTVLVLRLAAGGEAQPIRRMMVRVPLDD